MGDISFNTVQFFDDGIVISYAIPEQDARPSGVTTTHTVFIPSVSFGPEVQDVLESVTDALYVALSRDYSSEKEQE